MDSSNTVPPIGFVCSAISISTPLLPAVVPSCRSAAIPLIDETFDLLNSSTFCGGVNCAGGGVARTVAVATGAFGCSIELTG